LLTIEQFLVVEVFKDHWKARDAEVHDRSMPPGIDIEIVQERGMT
jgi:hypothetical protein